MPRFVELTRVAGGYIIVNLDEVLTIKESNTSKQPIPNRTYKGFYSVITFKKPQTTVVLVKETPPEIKAKYAKTDQGDLW